MYAFYSNYFHTVKPRQVLMLEWKEGAQCFYKAAEFADFSLKHFLDKS